MAFSKPQSDAVHVSVLPAEVVEWALQRGRQTGSTIHVTHDPREAVEGADVVVSDVGCEVVDALRRYHPQTPIVTGAPPDELPAAVADAFR